LFFLCREEAGDPCGRCTFGLTDLQLSIDLGWLTVVLHANSQSRLLPMTRPKSSVAGKLFMVLLLSHRVRLLLVPWRAPERSRFERNKDASRGCRCYLSLQSLHSCYKAL
jgi:hypothetical protein